MSLHTHSNPASLSIWSDYIQDNKNIGIKLLHPYLFFLFLLFFLSFFPFTFFLFSFYFSVANKPFSFFSFCLSLLSVSLSVSLSMSQCLPVCICLILFLSPNLTQFWNNSFQQKMSLQNNSNHFFNKLQMLGSLIKKCNNT